MSPPTFTVGHGLLDAEQLTALLQDAGTAVLVDVRSQPWSRRNPAARKDALERWVPAAGIDYRWERDLGGRRSEAPADRDPGIDEPGFRAYTAHMRSAAFTATLRAVLERSGPDPVALMCAEGDWRRCHRRFIADVLTIVHERSVVHLGHDGDREPHPPHPTARATPAGLVYDVGVDRPLPGT